MGWCSHIFREYFSPLSWIGSFPYITDPLNKEFHRPFNLMRGNFSDHRWSVVTLAAYFSPTFKMVTVRAQRIYPSHHLPPVPLWNILAQGIVSIVMFFCLPSNKRNAPLECLRLLRMTVLTYVQSRLLTTYGSLRCSTSTSLWNIVITLTMVSLTNPTMGSLSTVLRLNRRIGNVWN